MNYLQPTNKTGALAKEFSGQPEFLRLVVLAPKGNAVAYVDLDNNLYYRPSLMVSIKIMLNIFCT